MPFLPGTRIVETFEMLHHDDNKSVISIEVKTLDTPVSSFYYYKTVWMVIGEGMYSGFYRCMNPEGTIRQFNKDVSPIIGKDASS